MKRLIVSEILLISETEKKARKETFDPIRTIILGSNDTGKSSLIKSIYQAFGAEPAKVNPRWKAAEVKILLKFTIEGIAYQILRDQSYFAIFAADGRFIKAFTRVATELAPFLADLFSFGLVLASRTDEPQIPPPAYLFLPFYMDQDAGWQGTWSSFANLWQYSSWRDSLVEYHTGIRNNAYYNTNAELIRKRASQAEALGAERGIAVVLGKLARDTTFSTFSLEPSVYSERIERLLKESQVLAGIEDELRSDLAKLASEAALLQARLAIAEKALGEISDDFKFLSGIGTDSVECPTCGNHYDNDFVARFSIASDEDRVAQFIAMLRANLARVQGQTQEAYVKYSIAQEQAETIQKILSETQGEVTLQSVIEGEGRRAADNLLNGQLAAATEVRVLSEAVVEALEQELTGLNKNAVSVRRERTTAYATYLRRNFLELDVKAYAQNVFQSLNPSIFETGSTLPRSLLAYQFAVLQVIALNTPATVCPIVIDSPNQQGQDKEHLPQILSFIAKNQPENTQLILGIETDLGIEFGGKLITTPAEKQSLLVSDQYQACHDEYFSLLKLSLK